MSWKKLAGPLAAKKFFTWLSGQESMFRMFRITYIAQSKRLKIYENLKVCNHHFSIEHQPLNCPTTNKNPEQEPFSSPSPPANRVRTKPRSRLARLPCCRSMQLCIHCSGMEGRGPRRPSRPELRARGGCHLDFRTSGLPGKGN